MKPNPEKQFISIVEKKIIKEHRLTNTQARRIAYYMWKYHGFIHELAEIIEELNKEDDIIKP